MIQGREKRIDGCIANTVRTLNEVGVKTKGSCCGHGRYPMTIIVEHNGEHIELMSGAKVPRTRNFYKLDDDGYYYLLETLDL